MDYLTTDYELLSKLFSKEVINREMKESLQQEMSRYKRNDQLYSHIMSCAYDKVMQFRDVLRQTGKEVLAKILDFDFPEEATTKRNYGKPSEYADHTGKEAQ